MSKSRNVPRGTNKEALKRKLRADPGMYVKMRKQRRQKVKVGGGMIDHTKPQQSRDQRQFRRELKAIGNAKPLAEWIDKTIDVNYSYSGQLNDIADTQTKYQPTKYESGVRDAAAGRELAHDASRSEREGYVNKHRERLKLLVHMFAAKTDNTTARVWRMRKRLAAQYMVRSRIATSSQEAREIIDKHPMPDVMLCKVFDSIVAHTK